MWIRIWSMVIAARLKTNGKEGKDVKNQISVID
jgi:hypothetical protein